MEAREKSFKSIMQESNFIQIPFFQRKYVWKRENWEQFFDDLKNSYETKKEHFLGSVIFKRYSGDKSYLNLIDGQQRLTTFSILAKVICENMEKDNQKYFRDYFIESYTENKSRIKHSELDSKEYNMIIQKPESIAKKNDKDIKEGITDCYLYFSSRINEIDDKCEFLKFISDDSKLFVTVFIQESEDEQKIFDSINSTGMPLNAADIIKNAIFDRVIKLKGEETAKELYNTYWENVFLKDEEERKFWDSEILTSHIRRTQIEIFLHAFALIEGFFNIEEDNISKLSYLYKAYIKDKDIDFLKEMLNKIFKYAKTYRKFPIISKDTLFNYDETENRFFLLVNEYNISVFLPLILFLKHNLDKKEYLKNLYLIEILLLCNHETKGYNKFVAKLIKDIKENLKNSHHIILKQIKKSYGKNLQKDNIEEYWLNCISNKDATFILFWIELFREYKQKDYKDRVVGLNFIYTLEHLAPQDWEKNWKDVFKDDDEAYKFIYKIGNMTLLKGRLNSALRNSTWDKKINGDGKAKNFISKYADLELNKELVKKPKWDKKEIENRTKEIINDFYNIWDVDIFKEEK